MKYSKLFFINDKDVICCSFKQDQHKNRWFYIFANEVKVHLKTLTVEYVVHMRNMCGVMWKIVW